MEIIAIILVLWLVGCAFPGSGRSYGPGLDEVLGFIACTALIVGLVFAWSASVAGILMGARWLGLDGGLVLIFALLGPIALPLFVAEFANACLDRKQALL